MKRLFATILTIALAFTLALPVFAENDPNPAMPVITVQPEGGRVRTGQSITLSVEAYIPNGDEIGFRWYDSQRTRLVDSQHASLDFTFPGTYKYYVEAYNISNPEYAVTSQAVTVEVYYGVLDWIGAGSGIFLLPLTLPALFIFLAGFWPGLMFVAEMPQVWYPAVWLLDKIAGGGILGVFR